MGNIIKNLLFAFVWIAVVIIAGSIFYNSVTKPMAHEMPPGFLASLVKFSPLIITIPISILMLINQVKIILKFYKNEY